MHGTGPGGEFAFEGAAFLTGPVVGGAGWRPAQRLPVARELGETSLMFLVHPTLTAAQTAKTCTAIDHVLRKASA